MNTDFAGNLIPGPTLTRAHIAGRLSIVERGTLTLAAKGGLTVHVRSGTVGFARPRDGRLYRQVRAGESYFAQGSGRLTMRADVRSEIEIDWADAGAERLSPALEPVTLAA
ncbi:MAG: hypothetical protein OEW94_05035 [Betaproteobacteria bacterium]|nr:hypothetical protein [Betaproteobacteria bacterium]